MREIKFRAWSDKKKQMEAVTLDWGGRPIRKGYQWFQEENDLTKSQAMQYTGLKDKNGVEIYEGDIVKSKTHKPSEFTVAFFDGCFYCCADADSYPISLDHFYPSNGCCVEVIGNIYETKSREEAV